MRAFVPDVPYVLVSQLPWLRRAQQQLAGIRPPRRLSSMGIDIAWCCHNGWYLRLPSGFAVKSKSGHPNYFSSAAIALSWAEEHLRLIRSQIERRAA